MIQYPGTLTKYPLTYEKKPDAEFDANGIPFGIQPDPEHPYLDADGRARAVSVYRPSTLRPMMNVHAMIVVSDSGSEEDVERALVRGGFLDLAESEGFFLFFALSDGGWKETDTGYLAQLLHAVSLSCVFSGRERCHDYRICFIAEGRGTALAYRTAAAEPDRVNSLLSFGGRVERSELSFDPHGAATSVWAVNLCGDGLSFWMEANSLTGREGCEIGDSTLFVDPDNRAKQVRSIRSDAAGFDGGILLRFWREVFRWNINPFSTGRGRVASILDALEGYRPSLHLADRSLGDNGNAPHDWLEFIPSSALCGERKVPLIVFLHGGACDAFIEAANTELHKLGEKEGFLTVYATATNGYSWNNILHPAREDDVAFLAALIRHMLACYPVDPARVYMSGFSNGSGMAQVFSALHPELVAGLLAFNTRFQPNEALLRAAADVKARFDYRLPVFYSYGTRDAEYPLRDGCGQFGQIRFWSRYNGLDPAEPRESEGGVGVKADRVLRWGPEDETGEPIFTTHDFDAADFPDAPLYRYTLVRGLPHAVENRLFPAGWAYLSQFSRLPDGSLRFERRNDG